MAEADAGSKFFTTEWRNVERNWLNYLADLSKMIEMEEDSAVLNDLQVLEKQVLAAKAVLTKVSKIGLGHAEVLETYQSQEHYLSSAPLAASPFPPYLVRSMHSQCLQDAWPADHFWKHLSDDALAKFLGASEIEKFQVTAFASKVMLLLQDVSAEVVLAKMNSFCSSGKEAVVDRKLIKSSLVEVEVVDLCVVVAHGSPAGHEVEEENLSELARVLDSCIARKFWEALYAFPRGRALLDEAKARRSKLMSVSTFIKTAEEIVQKSAGDVTPEDVMQLNKIVQREDMLRARVAKTVSVVFLSSLLAHVLREYVAGFIRKEGEYKIARSKVSLMLDALVKSEALHSTHAAAEV